jgi:hypothetical protein
LVCDAPDWGVLEYDMHKLLCRYFGFICFVLKGRDMCLFISLSLFLFYIYYFLRCL